eukprot:1970988-Amphidinium_carterae.1
MKRTISAHLMPDASKRSIKGASKAVLCTVGTTFQMSIALRAETGFQASKVWPSGGNFVRLTPSEALISTMPSSCCRCPGKLVSE